LDMAGVLKQLRFLSRPESVQDYRGAHMDWSLRLLGLRKKKMLQVALSGDQGVLIVARQNAIAAKNWPEADRIRDELLAQGIQLKDGKDPVTGERVTTWEVKR